MLDAFDPRVLRPRDSTTAANAPSIGETSYVVVSYRREHIQFMYDALMYLKICPLVAVIRQLAQGVEYPFDQMEQYHCLCDQFAVNAEDAMSMNHTPSLDDVKNLAEDATLSAWTSLAKSVEETQKAVHEACIQKLAQCDVQIAALDEAIREHESVLSVTKLKWSRQMNHGKKLVERFEECQNQLASLTDVTMRRL